MIRKLVSFTNLDYTLSIKQKLCVYAHV